MMKRYNPCPHYPDGTLWEVFVRGRFGQCAWNMVSFSKALKYVRDQHAQAVAAAKARRHPGDEHSVAEFWAFIDGPGGRLEWRDLEPLVTGRPRG